MSTKVRFYGDAQNIGKDVLSVVNGDVWAAVVDGVTAGHIVHLEGRTHIVKGAASNKQARNDVRSYLCRDIKPKSRITQYGYATKLRRTMLVADILA